MPSAPTTARPRLIASQLRGLLRDPGDARAMAAGRALLERFVRLHGADGPEVLRENANALMSDLVPTTFDPASWNAPPSTARRDGLGAYAVVFNTLQTHLHKSTPPGPPRAPSMPAEFARSKDLALTITGERLPRDAVPGDLTVLVCDEVGHYSQKQWADAAPALQVLAPLLLGHSHRDLVVRRILLTTDEHRAALVEAFSHALRNTHVHPILRLLLVKNIARVRPLSAPAFARVAAIGFQPLLGKLTLDSGLQALATMRPPTLDTLLEQAGRSDAGAQWVAAIAMVLAGQPDLPGHRRELAQLLTDLAPFVASRTPEAAQSVLEPLIAETADRAGLVQATRTALRNACVAPDVFAGVVEGLQAAPGPKRMGLALALSTHRVQLWDANALKRVIAALSTFTDVERNRFMRQFDGLFRGARNLDDAVFSSLVECMAAHGVAHRDTLLDLVDTFSASDTDLVQRAHKLRHLDAMDPTTLEALQNLGAALPSESLGSIIEVLVEVPAESRTHVLECVLRLAPPRLTRAAAINAASAVHYLGALDTIRRELAVSHMATLGFDVRLKPFNLTCVGDCLFGMESGKRSATVRAFRCLVTPALTQASRASVLMLLAEMPAFELAEFVQSCRLNADWDTLSGARLMQEFTNMSAVFQRGERVDPYGVVDTQNVHRAMFTQPAIDSIKALLAMGHRATRVDTYIAAANAYIDVLEQDLPKDHSDRQIQPGRTRTLFDDARHALNGPAEGQDWSSFADNDEAFQIDGQEVILVGDLGRLVWQSILTYPEHAISVPDDEEAIVADKVSMLRNYVVKLADCIENGARVCYAGKTTRMLEVVQGFIQGVGVDDLDALAKNLNLPAENYPASALLTQQTTIFANRVAEPSLIQIEEFVAASIAAGEAQWSSVHSPNRRTYLRDLSRYVDFTFEEFGEAHPAIWDGLTDPTPRPSSPAEP